MTLDKYFGWFFSFVKSLVNILNEKLVIEIGGITVSFWSILLSFFVIHLIIAALIKSGGARSD